MSKLIAQREQMSLLETLVVPRSLPVIGGPRGYFALVETTTSDSSDAFAERQLIVGILTEGRKVLHL